MVSADDQVKTCYLSVQLNQGLLCVCNKFPISPPAEWTGNALNPQVTKLVLFYAEGGVGDSAVVLSSLQKCVGEEKDYHKISKVFHKM